MSQMVTAARWPLKRHCEDQEEQNQRLLVHKSRSIGGHTEPRRWEGVGEVLWPGSQGEWVGGTEPIFGPRHPDSVSCS